MGSAACLQLTGGFNDFGGFLTNGWILQLVPALIGAFVGAPVLAREMETGTYRYAWTQGFGRWRWTLAKLAGLAVSGDHFGWRHQRVVLLVLPAVLRRGQPGPGTFRVDLAITQPVRLTRRRVRRMDAGRLRDRRPRRHADPQGCPCHRRHPGRVRRTGHHDRGHGCKITILRQLVTKSLNVPSTAWIVNQHWATKGGQTISQTTLYQVLQGAPAQVAGKEGGGPNLHSLAAWQYLVKRGYSR